MTQPVWVSEGSIRKYHRALAQLTKEKLPLTDEAVKELYVKWGGLLLEQEAPAPEETVPEKKTSSKK